MTENRKHTFKYLGRYLSRVPITNSRIVEYDREYITYTYKEKTTRKTFFKTVNVLDFIGKLVQHINKKHFKSIRRFGLYARRLNRLSIQIVNLFNFVKQRNINDLIKQNINKKSNFRDRLVEKFTLIKNTCKIIVINILLVEKE